MLDLTTTFVVAAGAWLRGIQVGAPWLVYLANVFTLIACMLAASPLTRGVQALYWMARIERATAAEALEMSLTALAELELQLDGAVDRRALVARLRAHGRDQVLRAVGWIAVALIFAKGLSS